MLRFRVKTPGELPSNPLHGLMSVCCLLGKATIPSSPGGLCVQQVLGKCICEVDFQTCQRLGDSLHGSNVFRMETCIYQWRATLRGGRADKAREIQIPEDPMEGFREEHKEGKGVGVENGLG